MSKLSSTALPPLNFKVGSGDLSKRMNMPVNRIGWLHTVSNKPGAKFDVTIKDALGRVKMHKMNCGNDTNRYGELINMETHIGEELEVVLENVKGADEIDLFVN